ncbi:MAG: hypothetical protein QXU60_02145 [Sulfolobales archaeon]
MRIEKSERSRILEYLYRAFDERPAIVCKIRRVLTIILSLEISYLIRKRYDKIYISDLWGVLGSGFESPYVEDKDLEKVILGIGSPMILITTREKLMKRGSIELESVISLYSDGGASIIRALGFKPILSIRSSLKSQHYIIQDLYRNEIILFRITEKGLIQDIYLSQKISMALNILSEAFREYGAYKLSDAVRILMRNLGVDRIEAQKILKDLYERGIIGIERGGIIVFHILPQEDT